VILSRTETEIRDKGETDDKLMAMKNDAEMTHAETDNAKRRLKLR